MPSEDEIRFAKQRRAIFDNAAEHIEKVEKALGLAPCDGRSGIECPGGRIQEHTLEGQLMVIKRAYQNEAGERRYFEISIGHTGDAWSPVVTILQADGGVRSILFGAELPPDLTLVKETIAKEIAACVAN